MNSVKNIFLILSTSTIIFIIISIYIKNNEFDFPIIIPVAYFIFCFIILKYSSVKYKNRIINLIEKDYPELSNKLTSKLLDFNLGISSQRFNKLTSFGAKTGYDNLDSEITKFKIMNAKLAAINILCFIVMVLIILL